MPRLVIPDYLVLRLASLDGTATAGRVIDVEKAFGDLLRKRKHDTREPGAPVSLRWSMSPLLGFPRAPFEIWRRVRTEEPTTPVLGTTAPASPATATLPVEVIEIRFDAEPAPGAALTVEAQSLNGRTLPGQWLTFTANQSGRFRAAGIAALKLTGSGRILNVGALPQTDWANLPDWERIEVVGFAFDPTPQGWEVPSLTGWDAAVVRLGVARILQLDPPPVGAGGLVTPPWPFPDPKRFLDVLRLGPLADIEDCLASTDDTDPLRLQVLHTIDRTLPGMRQPGQPAGEPATLSLTTTQYIALAVQDGPVATGLGFGTVDIPQMRQAYTPGKDVLPPGTVLGRDEYLVTARVVLPGGIPVELAAIGSRTAPPAGMVNVTATQTFANRATQRDGEESVAVRLSWAPTLDNPGAGLLSRRAPGGTTLFNTPRPAGSGGFQPYLTEHRVGPDGNPAADVSPGVTMPEEVVPTSGSATISYAVAPVDIHGRWGPWRLTSHTTTARPVQQPALHEAAIALPATLPASGPVAGNCTLTVEFSWDWADRSCHRAELAGAFVPLGPLSDPPPVITGLQLGNGSPAQPSLVVSFTLSGQPSVPAPATVREVVLPVAPGPPPTGAAASDIRRYRVEIPGLSLNFSIADQLAYALAARGAEMVRPAELSAQSGPRQLTTNNPFPAPPPPLPVVDVLWTAQPDAAGRARTVLSWPASPGAFGYIIWEATETALFHAVSGGGSRASGPIRARAADLKARVAANQDVSLESFSRLNERPLRATSIELELPGSADTLFAYRISTITAQNVESARSTDIVLVGVPHREVPPAPHLEAVADSAIGRVTLTVVPGKGIIPAFLQIHRVRREGLADHIGSMGPPVIGPVAVATLTEVPVPRSAAGYRFVDTVSPSWQPYRYRCVATGRDALADGIRAGDSAPSAVTNVLVPPPTPPLLANPTRTTSPTEHVVTVRTDLPWSPSPAGTGTITVAAVTVSGTSPVRTVLGSFASHEIPNTAGPASRTAPINGVATVTLRLPPAAGTLVITATDPFGRSTSVELV